MSQKSQQKLTPLTHLHLSAQHLNALALRDALIRCQRHQKLSNVKILYAHDNDLEYLPLEPIEQHENVIAIPLDENVMTKTALPALTHLYVQHNKLRELQVATFRHLQKVYAEGNSITYISCVDDEMQEEYRNGTNCEQSTQQLQETQKKDAEEAYFTALDVELKRPPEPMPIEELHLSNQRSDAPLKISIRSCIAISHSLRVLKINNVNMDDKSLINLRPLTQLLALDIGKNYIQQSQSIALLVNSMEALRELETRGNPACKCTTLLTPTSLQVRHRDLIIIYAASALEILDNRQLQPNEREFLQSKLSKLSSNGQKRLHHYPSKSHDCRKSMQQSNLTDSIRLSGVHAPVTGFRGRQSTSRMQLERRVRSVLPKNMESQKFSSDYLLQTASKPIACLRTNDFKATTS